MAMLLLQGGLGTRYNPSPCVDRVVRVWVFILDKMRLQVVCEPRTSVCLKHFPALSRLQEVLGSLTDF